MLYPTVPSEAPQDISYTTGSRYIVLAWSPVICPQCNGPITDYVVDFVSAEGAVITTGSVLDETFTATQLTPNTNYTFRVAGGNSNGTGPFSQALIVSTDEDSMF